MDIKVRLFATLREGRAKELMVTVEPESSPLAIIENLNIGVEDVAILLINGRDGDLNQSLKSSDVLSIFPPVGGG
jgi:molybdopterin converting factor small subunit